MLTIRNNSKRSSQAHRARATTNEVRTYRISPILFNLYTKGKDSHKQKQGSNQSTKPTTKNLPFWQAPVRKPLQVEVDNSPRRFNAFRAMDTRDKINTRPRIFSLCKLTADNKLSARLNLLFKDGGPVSFNTSTFYWTRSIWKGWKFRKGPENC